MNPVELFLIFMNADARIPDTPYWSISLKLKINALSILKKRFLEQIEKTYKELEEMKSSGQIGGKEYIELIVLHDAFLNSVYSLFENISEVVRYLYSSKSLPRGFSRQKKRFIDDEGIDRDYANILKTTRWYDEINPIRDEVVHYLSGLVIFGESNKLGYINIPKSERKDALKEIKIDDIEKHVKQTHGNVEEFLIVFSNHFLKILNQSSRMTLSCLSSSNKIIGYRSISLKEFLNGEQGVCLRNDDCPERTTCQASKS